MSNFNEHGLPCPIDWTKAPKWAKYIAVNNDGKAYAYAKKPNLHVTRWVSGDKMEFLCQIDQHQDAAVFCIWQRPKVVVPSKIKCPVVSSAIPNGVNYIVVQPDGSIVGTGKKPEYKSMKGTQAFYFWDYDWYESTVVSLGKIDAPKDAGKCIWKRPKAYANEQ